MQYICMGRALSEPSELTEPHSVFAAMLPHKSLLFIYFSCPGEMLLQRGERFLPDHGQLWMLVRMCVPKLSREHVKKSCGQRMLLLPVDLRELQTERRDELIQ